MMNRTQPYFLTPEMAQLSERAADWFEELRGRICGLLETIERDAEIARSLISPLAVSSAKTGHVMVVAVAKYQ